MTEYKPACEQFPEEDFSFEIEVADVDDETWEVCHNISANTRCYTCFFKERCIEALMVGLADEFEVSRDSVTEKWSIIVN